MREESLQNIQNNQYVGGGTLPMNAMYFAFGNPITDSMVVNAFAKTNSAAFEMALNTGVYGNHTIAGGNFLYNALQGNRFTGKFFKDSKTWSVQPFKKLKFLNENSSIRNFSWNFISSKDLDKPAGAAVSGLAEKTGLNKTSEIVRTGWGFGRNHKGFFGALNDIGYNMNSFHPHGISSNETKKNIVSFIKNMDEESYKKFSSTLNEKQLKNLNKIRIGKKRTANDAIVKALGDFSQSDASIIDWTSKNLSDDILKTINTATDEQVIKLADEFLNIGGSLTRYSSGTKVITNEIKEELAEAIGKKFASRTVFEKLISNPLVRIATGAAIALPTSVAIPLAIATTGVGIVASAGQENAINNFINSNLYNETQYDRYSSQEANSSLYSASNIRDLNLQTLVNAYSDINVANRYLNDMDSISSDYKFSSDDAEVI